MALQNLLYLIPCRTQSESIVDAQDVLERLPSSYPEDIVSQARQALDSEPDKYPRTTALAVSGYSTLTVVSCFVDEKRANEK